MNTVVMAWASERPTCLEGYLPGSAYLSLQDMVELENLDPKYLVVFDARYLRSRRSPLTKTFLHYTELLRKKTCPLVYSMLWMSPETAPRFPEENELLVVPPRLV